MIGPSVLARACADIEFALGSGGAKIERSTFGAMLERWALYSHDSDGRPIPPATDHHMKVTRHHEEPGYDLDFGTLARIGRGLKLLDAVGAQSPLLRAALEAFHGERGARWGREAKADNSGGMGDRDVSVYPLTEMGRKWVRELRKRFPLSGALRADEVLANEVATQKRSPNDDMRRQRLRHCAVQARGLIAEAHSVLEATAWEQTQTARAIRRASVRAEMRRAG